MDISLASLYAFAPPHLFQGEEKGGFYSYRSAAIGSSYAAARAGKMKVIGLGDPKILVGADLVLKDLSQIDLSGIGRLFSKAAASR